MPGYTLIPIDCENVQDLFIAASGAVHCIARSVGIQDPLHISHKPLPDSDNTTTHHKAVAYMNHREGIDNEQLNWKTNIEGSYTEVEMTALADSDWQRFIPAQATGTMLCFYARGEANTGKEQVRPMPAQDGNWTFDLLGKLPAGVTEKELAFEKVFPILLMPLRAFQ